MTFRDVLPVDPGGARWCERCDTQHPPNAHCPGPQLATGADRHGWRARIRTWHGPQIFGVLVAPVKDRWRARILTFPDALWLVPGGTTSMKFVGSCPSEAEMRAITFIREHCRAKGFSVGDVLPPAQPAAIPAERAPEATPSEEESRAIRKLHAIPIRFGEVAPNRDAMTHDLSEEGLFIVTDRPVTPGKRIHMLLRVGAAPLALEGVVRWSRLERTQGRATGMGVQLDESPAIYLHYVRRLP